MKKEFCSRVLNLQNDISHRRVRTTIEGVSAVKKPANAVVNH